MSRNSLYRMSHIEVYCTTHLSICARDTGIDDIDYINEIEQICLATTMRVQYLCSLQDLLVVFSYLRALISHKLMYYSISLLHAAYTVCV